MKKTFAYALLVLTALYSCEEGKQEEPVLPETTPDEIYLRWVLSIPFFISCIRQQNPLTVLSKIILRKVKQFNLPPQKK